MAAAASQHDEFSKPYPPRPPITSQHSSSVPSTPYQQPRDLRFPSRSPSPGRGLQNHSPKSVASEAVSRPGARSSAPATQTVCRFEFAPELPKRRIKYVDGGDQELGPPKKEPKKCLSPAEEQKLGHELERLYDRLLPSDESENRRARLVKKLERILAEEWPAQEIFVNMFGSSGNMLSSSDSDVDICITTECRELENMHDVAKRLHKHGMEKVVCRAAAKVPIVKCWDPELELACDINVNNPLALENTRMIKTYVQLDDRVRPLAKIIKYWTKQRILNAAGPGGTISSYTWICMILSFLQRREPPIIPSLQKTPDRRLPAGPGDPSSFADDVEALRGCGKENTESLAELLFQFFRHYGYEFKYSQYVVSVREGRLLSRTEKGWEMNSIDNKEGRHRLCVEEPFNTFRNLGNSADEYSWSGVHEEIRRAFELLAEGSDIEKVCEQYEFPPESKHTFQRPPPKPKPTLTRSASQSGRPNQDSGGGGGPGRSRNKNRNQSGQRGGNRRASSGAVFGNQRNNMAFWQSPPVGIAMGDYFATKVNLHEQLYQQYHLLQIQQDMLKSQLAAQQSQVQSQRQASDGSLPGSAAQRPYASGLASPRSFDNPPQTAPLLPGYLYHYPARYPPPSPMSQARQREGTNTNPSSPSLVAAVPALRRQTQRAPAPEAPPLSTRSQSQPGRSLPHPLTFQQQVHPGYDVSGALYGQYGSLRTPQSYTQGVPFSPLAGFPMGQSLDSALPKEYVGYYVGQSPQLGPQYMAPSPAQMPTMKLHDPPQRQRRVTPDLAPPLPNGRHNSRSPSPLGRERAVSSVTAGTAMSDLSIGEEPVIVSSSNEPHLQASDHVLLPIPAENGEPIIVNGSNPNPLQKPAEPPSGTLLSDTGRMQEKISKETIMEPAWRHSLPLRANFDPLAAPAEGREIVYPRPPSPTISPTARSNSKNAPWLSFSPNGTPQAVENSHEQLPDAVPMPIPLLSPVEEQRTPSPGTQRTFEDSLHGNGSIKRGQTSMPTMENNHPSIALHARKGGASVPNTGENHSTSPQTTPTEKAPASNPWQQATSKRGHKKSKSSARLSTGGQPMPVNDAERKGG